MRAHIKTAVLGAIWLLPFLSLMIATAPSCASAPPTLGPAATTAWRQHEIQKDLDLIRDLAQDANAQTPPLLSTEAARKVTLWHETAITAVHDAPTGWTTTVLNGLDQLKRDLSPTEFAVIAPYVALARTVLLSVQP